MIFFFFTKDQQEEMRGRGGRGGRGGWKWRGGWRGAWRGRGWRGRGTKVIVS